MASSEGKLEVPQTYLENLIIERDKYKLDAAKQSKVASSRLRLIASHREAHEHWRKVSCANRAALDKAEKELKRLNGAGELAKVLNQLDAQWDVITQLREQAAKAESEKWSVVDEMENWKKGGEHLHEEYKSLKQQHEIAIAELAQLRLAAEKGAS